MSKHWSFAWCNPRYLYPLAVLLIGLGLAAAFVFGEASHFNRAGNFIIGTGVWMSLRSTLREDLRVHKDMAESQPTLPGSGQVNPAFFNQITFSIGDARLQVHGFALVVLGSLVGSLGDVLLKVLFPHTFS